MSLPLYNRPYVELDFTRMAFDTRVSFSRSSDGTYFDAAGVMQTAASNVPRKEHNPATGAVRGLLLEPQRTNLFTNSQFANGLTDALPRGGNLSAVTESFGPLGTTTGIRFDGGGVTSYAYKPGAAASTTYVISAFVYMEDGNPPTFGTGGGNRTFTIILGAGLIDPSTYSVVYVGGNTWRVSGSATTGTTGLGNNGIVQYSSNQNRRFRVTGYQLEAGTYSTSYTPTTTATVTRSADVASFTIPPRVVRLVTIYDDGTTSQQTVTPGASYTIPTGQKPILRIRGYFA